MINKNYGKEINKFKKKKSINTNVGIRIKDAETKEHWNNWKNSFKRKYPNKKINDCLNEMLKNFIKHEKKKEEFNWIKNNENDITKLFKNLWLEQNSFYWDKFNEITSIMHVNLKEIKLLLIYLVNSLIKKKEQEKVNVSKFTILEQWIVDYLNTKTKYKK